MVFKKKSTHTVKKAGVAKKRAVVRKSPAKKSVVAKRSSAQCGTGTVCSCWACRMHAKLALRQQEKLSVLPLQKHVELQSLQKE